METPVVYSLRDGDGTFGAGGNGPAYEVLLVSRNIDGRDVGVAILLSEKEDLGRRQGAKGMALADVWVDVNLHLSIPSQLVVEPSYSSDSHLPMTCSSDCPSGVPGEKVAGRCLYPLMVPMSS